MRCKLVLIIVFLFTPLVGCNSHSSSPDSNALSQYRGAKWLSWNDVQRDTFVFAYIDGFKSGTLVACADADKSFDFKNGRIPEHDKDEIAWPSTLCRANASDYSSCTAGASEGHVCSVYTQVITTFYTKHPEYQNIPFEYLMRYMTDKNHNNADELYSMAKSGILRTNW